MACHDHAALHPTAAAALLEFVAVAHANDAVQVTACR
jgi:hypothetical protein